MKLVIIESPYAGDIPANIHYARRALLHSLTLGEAPLASHLLYTQVLHDAVPEQRAAGIAAGLAWAQMADRMAVYEDLGISPGMKAAIAAAEEMDLPVVYRKIYRQNGPTL